VLLLVAFSAVIPLMTVVITRFRTHSAETGSFEPGLEWFERMLASGGCGTPAADRLYGHHFGDQIPRVSSMAPFIPKKERSSGRRSVWSDVRITLLGMSLGRFGRFSGALILAFLATLNAMGIDYNYTQDFCMRRGSLSS
jgi:hypothetical protein